MTTKQQEPIGDKNEMKWKRLIDELPEEGDFCVFWAISKKMHMYQKVFRIRKIFSCVNENKTIDFIIFEYCMHNERHKFFENTLWMKLESPSADQIEFVDYNYY